MPYNTELVSCLRKAGEPGSEQENNLLAAEILAGCEQARKRMITANTSLVLALVDKFTKHQPQAAYFRDDLCSAGFVALTKAVRRLAEKPHPNPTGLLGTYVRGAISDAFEAEAGWGPPRTRHRRRKQGRAVARIVSLNDDDGAKIIDKIVDPQTMPDLLDLIDESCRTEQDSEICRLRCEGFKDKEIAVVLEMKRSTVAARRKAIEARFDAMQEN